MTGNERRKMGARLREVRESLGLRQQDVAMRSGIHRPNISRLETGKCTPTIETLIRVARALDTQIEINMVPFETTQ